MAKKRPWCSPRAAAGGRPGLRWCCLEYAGKFNLFSDRRLSAVGSFFERTPLKGCSFGWKTFPIYVKTRAAKMFQPFSHRVFVLDFSRKRAERLVFQTFQKVSVFLLLPMLSGRCGQARRKNYDETEDFCQNGRFHRMFVPSFPMKTGPRKQNMGKTFDEKGDFCVWRAFPCHGSLWREWLLNLTVGKSPMWRFKVGLWIFSPRDRIFSPRDRILSPRDRIFSLRDRKFSPRDRELKSWDCEGGACGVMHGVFGAYSDWRIWQICLPLYLE